MPYQKLYRSQGDKMLLGVCGGIGEYFEIDPVLVRLLFLTLILSGIGIITYLAAWVMIPEKSEETGRKKGKGEEEE